VVASTRGGAHAACDPRAAHSPAIAAAGPVKRLAHTPRRTYPSPVLVLRNVHKAFGGPRPKTLFADLSFTLPRGAFLAVTGESGSGKSTLLNLLAGLEPPDRGEIEVDGRPIARLDERERALFRRRHVGFVFQAFHVLPYLSVERNVALPLELNDWAARDRDARVAEMLAAVGLADRGAALPRELSGGELQRVAVARALVHRPALVLADEPTGNLDAETADQVLALFREELRRNGATTVMVTHSARAAAVADRVVMLADGALVPVDTGARAPVDAPARG
jgi:putative ABC transport system ATP-binding protein